MRETTTQGLTREAVYEALHGVKDPCMGAAGLDLSIVDLGLVYGVEVEGGSVVVQITFTEPGCMFTHTVTTGVYDALEALPGVEEVRVTPTWMPVWTQERLNRKAARAFAEDPLFRRMKARAMGRRAGS